MIKTHLLSQQCMPDGQVSTVLQGENDHLSSVVESWSSSYIKLRAAGWNEWTHRVPWKKMKNRNWLVWLAHMDRSLIRKLKVDRLCIFLFPVICFLFQRRMLPLNLTKVSSNVTRMAKHTLQTALNSQFIMFYFYYWICMTSQRA